MAHHIPSLCEVSVGPQFPSSPSVIPNSQSKVKVSIHSSVRCRLVAASLSQRLGEPFETFVQTVSGGSAGGLDILVMLVLLFLMDRRSTYPRTAGEALKTELLGDFGRAHGVLAGQHQFKHGKQRVHTGKSCLLAKTSRRASRSSSSFNMRCNSSRASTIRSRSLLSTTKMIPWVFWK